MKKKILFILTDSKMGGTEKFFDTFLRNLDLNLIEPYVAVLKGNGEFADAYFRHSKYYVDCDFSIKKFRKVIAKLINIIDDNDINIVHSFLFHSNIIARLIKYSRKDIYIINSHRTMEKNKYWHLWIDLITKKIVDKELANSEAVRKFYIERTGSDEKKIITIYNGYSFTNNIKHTYISEQYDFLTIGSFSKAKGQMVLLRAFYQLSKIRPSLRLLLIGEGAQKVKCKKYVEEKKLQGSVKFLPKQTDIEKYYSFSDCLVIPSLWEGMPNVLFEAIRAKKYIISSDVGGVREIANAIDTIAIFRAGDVSHLKDEMLKYLKNKHKMKLNYNYAYNYIKENYSLFEMMSKYQNLYKIKH